MHVCGPLDFYGQDEPVLPDMSSVALRLTVSCSRLEDLNDRLKTVIRAIEV